MNRIPRFFLLVALAACPSCKKPPSALAPDASPPPSFAKPTSDASVEIDALWRDALRDDPLALAALADREGADALMVAVDQGGPTAVAALHALPYAHDAELALRRLGEIALQTDGDIQFDVVDRIRRIVTRPTDSRDVLDAESVTACSVSLQALAKNTSVRKATRASAISALRMLADHKQITAAEIPTDLDM